MHAMDSVYFSEGLVEYVDEKEIVTDECVVRVRGNTLTAKWDKTLNGVSGHQHTFCDAQIARFPLILHTHGQDRHDYPGVLHPFRYLFLPRGRRRGVSCPVGATG
jgi:hypothetical protein